MIILKQQAHINCYMDKIGKIIVNNNVLLTIIYLSKKIKYMISYYIIFDLRNTPPTARSAAEKHLPAGLVV